MAPKTKGKSAQEQTPEPSGRKRAVASSDSKSTLKPFKTTFRRLRRCKTTDLEKAGTRTTAVKAKAKRPAPEPSPDEQETQEQEIGEAEVEQGKRSKKAKKVGNMDLRI